MVDKDEKEELEEGAAWDANKQARFVPSVSPVYSTKADRGDGGRWSPVAMCPRNTFASAFRTSLDAGDPDADAIGPGDSFMLAGIGLKCTGEDGERETWIESVAVSAKKSRFPQNSSTFCNLTCAVQCAQNLLREMWRREKRCRAANESD